MIVGARDHKIMTRECLLNGVEDAIVACILMVVPPDQTDLHAFDRVCIRRLTDAAKELVPEATASSGEAAAAFARFMTALENCRFRNASRAARTSMRARSFRLIHPS